MSSTAREWMEPALVVSPSLSLPDLARQLLAADAEAACVCSDEGELLGVVSGMDLVFREKEATAGLASTLLDLVLTFGANTAREHEKLAAVSVGELMTREVVWVSGEATLRDIATRMVGSRIATLPVLEGGRVVGIVTRRAVIGATLQRLAAHSG